MWFFFFFFLFVFVVRLQIYLPMGTFRCNGVLHVFVVRWRNLPVPALALESTQAQGLWLSVLSICTVDCPSVPHCLCPLYVQLTVPTCRIVCAPCLYSSQCPVWLSVPYVCTVDCPSVPPVWLNVPSECCWQCTTVSRLTGCQCPSVREPLLALISVKCC